jgi:hypothetical protein
VVGAGVLAAVFAGCGGDAPTQETDSVDPAVIEALAADVIRGIKGGPSLDIVGEGLEGGSTGFGSGASTSGGFDGPGSTDVPFGGSGDTSSEFDSGATTTEVIGGSYPFALNYTNRLSLLNYDQLMSNPFANGLAVFSSGSTNEISWAATASNGQYEISHLSVEFSRDGQYVGELDSGTSMVSGTRYQYQAPTTSNLVVVLFIVIPSESVDEFNIQWGFAIVGNLS